MPDPATRSFTVPETRTSFDPGSVATMCTDRTPRTIESGHEAVAGRVGLDTAMDRQLTSY
jgi:hypothetical protein